MDSAQDRASIISKLREDMVGPTRWSEQMSSALNVMPADMQSYPPGHKFGPLFDQQKSEVLQSPPITSYGIGVLHPHHSHVDATNDDSQEDSTLEADTTDSLPHSAQEHRKETEPLSISAEVESADNDNLDIEGCNRLQQSSMGITFAARLLPGDHLIVSIPSQFHFKWQEDDEQFATNGMYKSIRVQNNGHMRTVWQRKNTISSARKAQLLISCDELLSSTTISSYPVDLDSSCETLSLKIKVLARKQPHLSETERLITVVFANDSESSSSALHSTLFQALFTTSFNNTSHFIPLAAQSKNTFDSEEQQLALLYRDMPTWAIGHGCTATWDSSSDERPREFVADVFPTVELPSMDPNAIDQHGTPIDIEIYPLATAHFTDEWDQRLQGLVTAYEHWIEFQAEHASQIEEQHQNSAVQNISACRDCLDRMRCGLNLLKSDEKSFEAFRLANAAMVLQQIAQKDIRQRGLNPDSQTGSPVPNDLHVAPTDLLRTKGQDKKWRAFQIAFLLMCICDQGDTGDAWKECVDLIWFPTGGGKTEAYLAYAAYTMFRCRLDATHSESNLQTDGVNVIMRYTLRMLTTQQFQRAASLICAMECLRQSSTPHDLKPRLPLHGSEFSLGLWIGRQGSPNKHKDAIAKLKKWKRSQSNSFDDKNPLVLRECPWCKSSLGKCGSTIAGFSVTGNEQVVIHCSDPDCMYGKRNCRLPIYVIDEDLYEHQPSFIISTVDKFAMLPYEPRIRCIFGFPDKHSPGRTKHPPHLIIQDELHLISGPLGSYFGLYESLIEEMCLCPSTGAKPKIICSTATIRGAQSQTQTLFARPQCRLFPAPGLSMDDSFYGKWACNKDGSLQKGRMYLGINGLSFPSAMTSQVRTFSSALQSVMSIPAERRDPWWTLLIFYNSFRDLGGSRTLFQSDIPKRLGGLYRDSIVQSTPRRWSPAPYELSGRLSQEEIIEAMERLGTRYTDNNSVMPPAIEACLSSSIIEVGVDVPRLSLMAVVGQPTTTARYIQVTGRIGRQWWERPGLVLMLYNATRPRDRSHFEQFQSYHEKLYSQVEPTSATPFSPACLERAIQAIYVGYIRTYKGHQHHEWPYNHDENDWDLCA